MTPKTQRALATLLLGLPLVAAAVPVVQSAQAFTDNVGPNPYWESGWLLGLGATSVVPAGPGTVVTAVHVPADAAQNYAISASPSPVLPNAYVNYMPYTGQTGVWQINASDGSGTGMALTHTLDDVRQLPLIQGLSAGGNLLAPTVDWTRLDPNLYPSTCTAPCAIGFDFFNYAVVVRSTSGTLLYQSSTIPNTPATATSWTLPAGVLAPDTNYVIGLRLNMNELEAINPNGTFVSPLENRSSSYLPYSTAAVPEPAALVLMSAGLGLLGLVRRRYQVKWGRS